MGSTGVVAIFISIVLRIASETGRSLARFLMPVSYGALISGMLTLIATALTDFDMGALEQARLRRAHAAPVYCTAIHVGEASACAVVLLVADRAAVAAHGVAVASEQVGAEVA